MRKRNGAAINPSPKPTDDWMQDPMATSAKTASASAGSSGNDKEASGRSLLLAMIPAHDID
jgi:hypothetical protein